jgi:hypothetical protein
MIGQEALKTIDRLLKTSKQQGLNDLQSSILLAVWEGQSYQMLADRLNYEVDYIKQIASRLWKQIAQIVGEDVSKRNIQSVLRRYQQTHEVRGHKKIQDWGDAIDVSFFYGRQSELQTLETWTLSSRCRFIGIFGLGGIGKTTLSVKLAQTIQDRFDRVIWRSLQQAPLLQELLEDIVPKLTDIKLGEVSVKILMEQLQKKHFLLVLDNFESILQNDDCPRDGKAERTGQYKSGYEDYCQLLEHICDRPHQSCLILTGREKPKAITMREGTTFPVRSLQLQGLAVSEAKHILIDKGLVATTSQYQTLFNYFGGNPLALKIAATTIETLFCGDIQAFLAQGSTVFSSLWDLLDSQFQRLSPLQQQVMYWFALDREEITPIDLQAKFLPKLPLKNLLETLEVLHERSLIETTETGLSQQPAIVEYVTEIFIQNIEREIIEGKLNLFKTHAPIEAKIQTILQSLAERLLAYFGSNLQLKHHLYNILDELREINPTQIGYGKDNLFNLAYYLKPNLKGFGCSDRSIRQPYLLNAVLHERDLTNDRISQTVLAETFGSSVSIAFSPDRQRLATSNTTEDFQKL